jgi:hypothetical protein
VADEVVGEFAEVVGEQDGVGEPGEGVGPVRVDRRDEVVEPHGRRGAGGHAVNSRLTLRLRQPVVDGAPA